MDGTYGKGGTGCHHHPAESKLCERRRHQRAGGHRPIRNAAGSSAGAKTTALVKSYSCTATSDTIEIASHGGSFVVTSGTGSGKSLSSIIPIVNRVLKRAREEISRNGFMIVIYPMNALCNSQQEELQKYLGLGYPEGPKVTFARYTGQESDEVGENQE